VDAGGVEHRDGGKPTGRLDAVKRADLAVLPRRTAAQMRHDKTPPGTRILPMRQPSTPRKH